MNVRVLVTAGVLAVGMLCGAADAWAGWAGSQYDRGDCMRLSGDGRPGLYCEKSVSQREHGAQETIAVADAGCSDGIRLVLRTGTLITRYDVFDVYDGPAPLSAFNVGGNETNYTFEWADLVVTDLGCG